MVLSNDMVAELILHDKFVYRDGAIREMVLWRLPEPDSDRPHGLKHRLFYGYPGQCLVRYDNERGKGDHRHYMDNGVEYEELYIFVSVEQLIADFRSDIQQLRGQVDE